MYSYLNKELTNVYSSKTLKENYNKILITMLPIIPHFASEGLEENKFNIKNKWPEFNEKMTQEDRVNLVIQLNGKKRGLLKVKKDSTEREVLLLSKKDENLKRYINDHEKIKKIIFFKNRILNIII